MSRANWESVLCDSLEKVLPRQRPREFEMTVPLVAFQGERVSFQVAVVPPSGTGAGALPKARVVVSCASPAIVVAVSTVELVPVELPALEEHDEGWIGDLPGLYPDLVRPGDELTPVSGQWRAAWVTLDVASGAPAGPVEVEVEVTLVNGQPVGSHRLRLEVVGCQLPPLDIVNTHWFHCDGLANYYGLEVFGEEHWAVIDAFLASAAAMSINSVLTPIWTPPLDVAVGGFRTPTQLLGVEVLAPGHYEFDFTLVRRWVELCRKHGLRYLELPHLFSQWGARYTPTIYATVAGETKRIFSWENAATDPSYRVFLEQLLPRLKAVLDECWGLDRVIWHISDEPSLKLIDLYQAARNQVADLIEGLVTVDALSSYEFYARGLVPIPVVSTDAAEPFLAAGVDPLWLYYCTGQTREVSNRFIAMPSARNRVLGTQLFVTGVQGFLHWGFNFYNSALSVRAIDPFADTCAGGAFLGGDPFMVYPGEGGRPWPSIRYHVFAEAMADHRAMQLLRDLTSRERVLEIVDPENSVTVRSYSLEANHYRRVRAELAYAIRNSLDS